ncbi:SOS response-associated peptidase [Acinetobacter chinensis]|uniref:SOS response-associated peptidase n=1 Tax=Acinetobacter chinensis TaxID=2004650 RepID=UPI002934B254|nr:SOS response-associated peptidase family protein [Acinetobacter chinensis]WOE40029.1 SOS response-associated peptidase family protein [Acinetobacter chinensis]
MCSNYKFPAKGQLRFLDVNVDQFDIELKDHVYPAYHAPIIMRGFELDVAKFGMLPAWAKDFKFSNHTYNARTETIAEKPSFRHAWKFSKFCLVPVVEFYEPKYINGKPQWYTIRREDSQPFTVAGIYEDAVIRDSKVRSFSMLTINADQHPFMKQFHAPADEKRSIIVIPEQYRQDWLNADHEHAHEYFFEMQNEYVTYPRESPVNLQGSLL